MRTTVASPVPVQRPGRVFVVLVDDELVTLVVVALRLWRAVR